MRFLFIIISICLLFTFKGQAQLPSERTNSIEKALVYKKDKQVNPSQTTLTSLPSDSKDWSIRLEKYQARFNRVSEYQQPGINTLPSTRRTDFNAIIRKYRNI